MFKCLSRSVVSEEHLFCQSVASVLIVLPSIGALRVPSRKSKTADRIFMKFGMNVMVLEASPNSYF
jgi:hypothetical protein